MSAFDDSDLHGFGFPAEHEPAPPVSADEPVRRLDLGRLADALPRLGPVLWLERRPARASTEPAALGGRGPLLIEHPALGALAQCTSAVAQVAVTPLGPREWLCLRDRAGEAQAKLFLLPDTDYLAWDEMTAACQLDPALCPTPPRWSAHGAFLRGAFARLGAGWRARLLTFRLRRMPWLRTLDAQAPLRMSLLGLELAQAIARDESAELVSPLHRA